jgi:hypothetical protein
MFRASLRNVVCVPCLPFLCSLRFVRTRRNLAAREGVRDGVLPMYFPSLFLMAAVRTDYLEWLIVNSLFPGC